MLRKSCENSQKAKTPKQPQNKKKMQKRVKRKKIETKFICTWYMDNVYTIYRFSLTFFCEFNLLFIAKKISFFTREKRNFLKKE